MTQQVVVPVRYPLTAHSKATLRKAIAVAEDADDAELTVLHVNLYHENDHTSRSDLKEAVEAAVGELPEARYVVRTGLLVEETILDEVVEQGADIVVIGQKQAPRWRRMVRRIVDDPDIEQYLERELDAKVVTASV
jgi:nucleotide-binding universal stress UspA family protein